MPRSTLPPVPESLKAWSAGWKDETIDQKRFTVVREDKQLDDVLLSPLRDTLAGFVQRMESALTSRGQSMSAANSFRYLLTPAIEELAGFTSQELHRRGKPHVSTAEMWAFIGTLLIRGIYKTGAEHAWMLMTQGTTGFVLMELDRFRSIMACLRGYDVARRSPGDADDTWLRQSGMLRNLSAMEVLIFKRSLDCLLNQSSGVLVLDDELIGCSSCVLCASPGCRRGTSFSCSICQVHLCYRGLLHKGQSCFDKWHKVSDLLREQKRRQKSLSDSRA